MAGTRTAERPDSKCKQRTAGGARSAPAGTQALAAKKNQTWEETKLIFERAEAGDAEALKEWRKTPQYEVLAEVFTLASLTERKLNKKTVGESCLVSQEYVKKELDEMRASLRGPAPTALEVLLIEEIVLCYFMLRRAQMMQTDFTSGSSAEFQIRENKVDRAQNRYLAAIRTLAQIRRLQIPALVQLNVATQQVNVAS